MSDHLVFVLSSYGLAALILLALIVWLMVDRHNTINELRRLEEQGLRRRSEEHKHDR